MMAVHRLKDSAERSASLRTEEGANMLGQTPADRERLKAEVAAYQAQAERVSARVMTSWEAVWLTVYRRTSRRFLQGCRSLECKPKRLTLYLCCDLLLHPPFPVATSATAADAQWTLSGSSARCHIGCDG